MYCAIYRYIRKILYMPDVLSKMGPKLGINYFGQSYQSLDPLVAVNVTPRIIFWSHLIWLCVTRIGKNNRHIQRHENYAFVPIISFSLTHSLEKRKKVDLALCLGSIFYSAKHKFVCCWHVYVDVRSKWLLIFLILESPLMLHIIVW